MRHSVLFLLASLVAAPAIGQSIEEIAAAAGGTDGTAFERTDRLLKWIHREFQWTATDYQQRSAEEIIRRRGGNCAELARVLERLLDASGIRYRRVREINVHPKSDRRKASAEQLVNAKGNRYSVFGSQHNDHVWLEVSDPAAGDWFPADPAAGVIGARDWLAARVAFDDRLRSPVPVIATITKDMIVPFAVIVDGGGADRSRHYLIDEFNKLYDGRLTSLPSWADWIELVGTLSPKAQKAFSGEVNLHAEAAAIERIAGTYERLRAEARQRELAPIRR